MKKTAVIVMMILGALTVKAQDDSNATTPMFTKGKWLVETNTGFGAVTSANTGFFLTSVDGTTAWNVGFEGGYFIMDRLALKLGLGYGNNKTISLAPLPAGSGGEGSEGGGEGTGSEGGEGDGLFNGTLSYKIGAKYYLMDRIPLQIDFSGNNITKGERYLGFQAGYAFPVANNITIEPGVRYGISLNNSLVNYSNAFQFNVGFAFNF